MNTPMSASQILENEFLESRAKLLELAAALDRLDRAEGNVGEDPRLKKIHESLAVLVEGKENRAERIQLLFSLPYKSDWKEQFAIDKS